MDLKRELEVLKSRAAGLLRTGKRGEMDQPPTGGLSGPGVGKRAYPPLIPSVRLSGPLEKLVPGIATESDNGLFYRIREEVGTIWPDAPSIFSEYLETLASPSLQAENALTPLNALQGISSSSICYLDIETTGLRNTPLFLIGLMYCEDGFLIMDQFFARDYTEEHSVLTFTQKSLDRFDLLVTFNGDRFDMPFIGERMAFFGLAFESSVAYLDLLPVSRSLLGAKTPNHRLQTLERFILGRKRTGDIPGGEIPGAYHDFVRTGDAGEIKAIIDHNRLDLLSMLELITVYLSGR